MSQGDAERARRLERHANWLYETNSEFRATVDADPSHNAVLKAIAIFSEYPEP